MENAVDVCSELSTFADYIESNHVVLNQIPTLEIPNQENDSLVSLFDTTLSCIEAISPEYTEFHNFERQEVYEIETCHMSAFMNNSQTTFGTLSFSLYTFLTLVELMFAPIYDNIKRSAISEYYLHTCTTFGFKDNDESCVFYLLESCFEFELYPDPFLCFHYAIIELCGQFGGDEWLKCEVLLEEKAVDGLENMCMNNKNDAKCVSIHQCLMFL